MNRVLLVAAVALSGVAFALSLYAVLDRPGETSGASEKGDAVSDSADGGKAPAVLPAVGGADAPLIRARVDRLAERLAMLESRPAQAVAVAKAQPVKEENPYVARKPIDLRPIGSHLKALEKRVEKLDAAMPATIASALTEDEAAREAVSGIVEEQLDKFRQERRERRQAMGDQVTDEIVNEFANKAGLSDEQFSDLYPALGELRQEMRENFRAMRRGEKDFADVRAAAKAARETFDEKARKTLNDEQYKLYEEEMNDRFGGPGGLFK